MLSAIKLLLAFIASSLASNDPEIDVTKSMVWGPAFTNDANVPVRYFYIQAVDKNGKEIAKDMGNDAFKLALSTGKPGERVRSWNQVLNRHNGSYIGRFRPYDYGGKLVISITHKGKDVADSPYTLNEMYSDDCYCPMNMIQWMKAMKCPTTFPQISLDFTPFPTIQLDGLNEKMLSHFRLDALCHYVVKNNEIYRQCHGKTTDFKMFVDEILLSITKKARLPDIELYWNLGDWPLEKNVVKPLPIVSWCGSDTTSDIILPTYDLTGSVLNMLGRVSLDVFSVQSSDNPPWEKKKQKGFFRGRDSRRERLNLAEMSVKSPNVIDAKITNWFFFKKDEKKYGKSVKQIPFFDFFKHKYQLNIDGTVAAYRFPYLMLGDSLVMKQDSEYYEHFYKELTPKVDYVRLRHDLTDVKDKVLWARKNDDEVHKIQQSGTRKAREILTPINVLCYHALVFQEFASRQNGTVKILDEMEKVKHKESRCNCRRLKKKPKDEL